VDRSSHPEHSGDGRVNLRRLVIYQRPRRGRGCRRQLGARVLRRVDTDLRLGVQARVSADLVAWEPAGFAGGAPSWEGMGPFQGSRIRAPNGRKFACPSCRQE